MNGPEILSEGKPLFRDTLRTLNSIHTNLKKGKRIQELEPFFLNFEHVAKGTANSGGTYVKFALLDRDEVRPHYDRHWLSPQIEKFKKEFEKMGLRVEFSSYTHDTAMYIHWD